MYRPQSAIASLQLPQPPFVIHHLIKEMLMLVLKYIVLLVEIFLLRLIIGEEELDAVLGGGDCVAR